MAATACEMNCACYFCQALRGKDSCGAGPDREKGGAGETDVTVFVASAAAQHAKYLRSTTGRRTGGQEFADAVALHVGEALGYVEHSSPAVRLFCLVVGIATFVVNVQEAWSVHVPWMLLLERMPEFISGRYPRTVRAYVQSESPVAMLYNVYQALFALITVVLELGQGKSLQGWLHRQARFLTTRRGRSLFYVFQATLSIFQFNQNDFMCGIGMLTGAFMCFFRIGM